MNTIEVAAKIVGEPLRRMWISNDIKSMQKFVDGYVQILKISELIFLICNEDGRAQKPLNAKVAATMPDLSHIKPDFVVNLTGKELPNPGEVGYHEIYGDFLFTRIDDGEAIGLTEEDFKRLSL